MDNISLLIILRALFIFFLLEKGWTVKKKKNINEEVFHIYKNVVKN
jgi:hypothetical protein